MFGLSERDRETDRQMRNGYFWPWRPGGAAWGGIASTQAWGWGWGLQ